MKAIHWPAAFQSEVLEESMDKLCCAFRLGRLYYDNQYWSSGEEVDIRVDHKIVRKGVIEGDMKCCRIEDLSPEDFKAQKENLKSIDSVIEFLVETYQQPVTPDTEITIVYYKNKALDPALAGVSDDPHMA